MDWGWFLSEAFIGYMILAAMGALISWFIGVAWYSERKIKRSWKTWKNTLNLQDDPAQAHTVRGAWKGYSLRMSRLHSSSEQALRMTLETHLGAVPRVNFRKETYGDRLAKFAGFTREFQANDSEFDRLIFIESEDRRIRQLLQSETLRERIRDLVINESAEILINSDGILLDIQGGDRRLAQYDPSRLRSLFDQLVFVAETVAARVRSLPPEPAPVSPLNIPFVPRNPRQGIIHILIVSCVLMGGIFLWFWGQRYPTFTTRLQWRGAIVGLLSALFVTGWIYAKIRGRSIGKHILQSWAIASLIGFPFGAVGGLKVSNALFDPDPGVRKQAEICSFFRSDNQYKAELRVSYRGVEGKPTVVIPDELATIVKHRQQVRIRVHGGFWEEPWVHRFTVSHSAEENPNRGSHRTTLRFLYFLGPNPDPRSPPMNRSGTPALISCFRRYNNAWSVSSVRSHIVTDKTPVPRGRMAQTSESLTRCSPSFRRSMR